MISIVFVFFGTPCRAADRYPKGASSNSARVNIFQLTSSVSDYHEKFLFEYSSEDDSEIDLITVFKVFRPSCSRQRIVLRNMAVSVASVTTVAHREIAKNYNVGYKFAANKSY